MPTLSREDHEHFLDHGYVLLKGLVPVDLIATALSYARSQDEQPLIGSYFEEVPEFAGCVTSQVHDAVAELYGPEYPFARTRAVMDLTRPQKPDGKPGYGHPGFGGHIDMLHASLQPEHPIWFWIFLTKLQPNGGALGIAPGSPYRFRAIFARGFRPAVTGFDNDSGAREFVRAVAGGLPYPGPLEEVLAEPGDVLIYHHLMGHSGSTNVSDPTTRHALQGSFVPLKRICAGTKPLDEMSTIEKANSTRYLSERMGAAHPAPLTPHLDPIPFQGIAHALTRWGGRFHFFELQDSRLQHSSSADFTSWDRHQDIATPGEALSMDVRQHATGMVLTLPMADERTAVLVSTDLRTWRHTGDRKQTGAHAATMSGVVDKTLGNVLLYAATDDPCRVDWICSGAALGDALATPWVRFEEWEESGTALHLARPITSMSLDCTNGLDPLVMGPNFPLPIQFALILETSGPPMYTTSPTYVKFSSPIELPYDSDYVPRDVRCVDRCRGFWLASFVGDGAVRLGTIDWESERPELSEIRTTAQLESAYAAIGWI